MAYPHQPVLAEAAVDLLVTIPDGIYVDGTCGSGGHGELIGKRLSARGCLICMDRDPEAVALTRHRLDFLGERVRFIQENYARLDRIVEELGIGEVTGVLLDLGMSSHQLERSGRGFSFNRDEPLDMRMDPGEDRTSADLINTFSQQDLERVLKDYGEEKRAGLIARAIVRARSERPIETSRQLALLVQSVIPPSHRPGARHPATRTFQALRIAVNRELEHLDTFLDRIPSLMAKGGRLVILSYHSLEDRRVKQAMAGWERGCICPADLPQCACGREPLFKRLLKKGLRPGLAEIAANPRARSAVLRASERI